jgi:hypothetical protein
MKLVLVMYLKELMSVALMTLVSMKTAFLLQIRALRYKMLMKHQAPGVFFFPCRLSLAMDLLFQLWTALTFKFTGDQLKVCMEDLIIMEKGDLSPKSLIGGREDPKL